MHTHGTAAVAVLLSLGLERHRSEGVVPPFVGDVIPKLLDEHVQALQQAYIQPVQLPKSAASLDTETASSTTLAHTHLAVELFGTFINLLYLLQQLLVLRLKGTIVLCGFKVVLQTVHIKSAQGVCCTQGFC